MAEWGMELKAFLVAVKRHWILLVTSSVFAASGFFYEHTSKPISIEIVWGAASLFLFISCFLAWRDEYRKVLTRQQRRTIREGLARVHQIGITLHVDCETTMPDTISDEAILDRFVQYDQEAQAYLIKSLDRSYATRFSDPTGLNLSSPPVNTTIRTRVWGFVANRQARLQEFIREYPDL